MRRGYFGNIERGENGAIVRRSLCAAIDPCLQSGEVRGGELRLLNSLIDWTEALLHILCVWRRCSGKKRAGVKIEKIKREAKPPFFVKQF